MLGYKIVRLQSDTMTSGTPIPGKLGLMELDITNKSNITAFVGSPEELYLLGQKFMEIAKNAQEGMATGFQTLADAAHGKTGHVVLAMEDKQISRGTLRVVKNG